MEPFMSTAEALENISAGASDNQHPQRNQGGFPKKKWNAKSPLRKTIRTRHAGCHPSGKRGFTTREVACLQGFPDDYDFFWELDSKEETDRKRSPALHGRTDIARDHQIVNGDGCETCEWV